MRRSGVHRLAEMVVVAGVCGEAECGALERSVFSRSLEEILDRSCCSRATLHSRCLASDARSESLDERGLSARAMTAVSSIRLVALMSTSCW